jgi:hypothetical protein
MPFTIRPSGCRDLDIKVRLAVAFNRPLESRRLAQAAAATVLSQSAQVCSATPPRRLPRPHRPISTADVLDSGKINRPKDMGNGFEPG